MKNHTSNKETSNSQASPTNKGAGKNGAALFQNNQDSSSVSSALIQGKLTIGSPNDPYEREADDIASKVIRKINSAPPNIQKKCKECGEEEMVQRKEAVQSNLPAPTISSNAIATPSGLQQQLQQAKGGGTALPNPVKSQMESAFGTDFSKVRVHDNSRAAQMADSIQAKAFTNGNDIFFNHGQFQKKSSHGQRLLAHELTHVLQQNKQANPFDIQSKEKIHTQSQQEITAWRDPSTSVLHIKSSSFASAFNEAFNYLTPNIGETFWWVRPSGRKKEYEFEVKTEKNTDGENHELTLKTWSGLLSELAAWSDEEISIMLDALSRIELLSVQTEAKIRDNKRVLTLANLAIHEEIERKGDASKFSSFLDNVLFGEWYLANGNILDLDSDAIGLFASQITSKERVNLRESAIRMGGENYNIQALLEGLNEYMGLLFETQRSVFIDRQANLYKESFGKNWSKAAAALDKFDKEIIFFELQKIRNNESLRALRKAADQGGQTKVSEIVTLIISSQDKAGIYLDRVEDLAKLYLLIALPGGAKLVEKLGLKPAWAEAFTKGLKDGGLDIALGDAWEIIESDLSSATEVAKFLGGFQVGVFKGILTDIYDNLEGLAQMVYMLVKYNVLMTISPYETSKEIIQTLIPILKGLTQIFLKFLDAQEFGYTAARLLIPEIEDFEKKPTYEKGVQAGTIYGYVLTEIALMFVGVGEVTAGMKILRGTSVFLKIEEALKGSKTIGKLMEGVRKYKLGKLNEMLESLQTGSKVADLIRQGEKFTDISKVEEVLSEIAKLEKKGGSLVTEQMKPLEKAVLEHKVKDPRNLRSPNKDFAKKYTVEIDIGEHTFRRRPDGTWCRFTLPDCGYRFKDGMSGKIPSKRKLTDFPERQTGLDRVAKFLLDLKSNAKDAAKAKVVALLKVDGAELFGMNGKIPTNDVFDGLSFHKHHAEIDTMGQAVDTLDINTFGKDAVMWVNKDPCFACITQHSRGNLNKSVRQLGFKSVTIHTPTKTILMDSLGNVFDVILQ